MNKMYLAIVGFLLVIALLVGGYAFYKTANQTPASYLPPTPVATPPAQTKNSSPSATTETKPSIPLTITSFKDGDIVSVAKLAVKGLTAPNAEVSVNTTDLKANAKGSFSINLTLEEGDNAIEVVASDADGNNTSWEATVTYTPAP